MVRIKNLVVTSHSSNCQRKNVRYIPWYKKDKPRMWILHFFAGSCDQIFVFYQLKYYLIIYKLLIIKENKNFKYFNDLIKHLFFVLNY